MLIAAAAADWKVPAAGAKPDSVITHRRAEDDLRCGRRRGSQLEPPKEVKLKDPRDWKIAGKAGQSPRHGRQGDRQSRSTASTSCHARHAGGDGEPAR